MSYKIYLLPYYIRTKQGIKFLNQIEVELSPEERCVVRSISYEGLKIKSIEQEGVQGLIQKGIIITEKVPNNRSTKEISEIIFATHSDDTALSMGGYLLVNKGSCMEIINVFSNCLKSINLSKYLRTPKGVTFFNNEEEKLYAKIMGTSLKFLHYPEALQRNYKNPITNKIGDQDKPLVRTLENQINQILIKQKPIQAYFPLSIGDHIDHIILYKIGRLMLNKGFNILFYEDLPYTKEIQPLELKTQFKEKTRGLRVIKRIDISEVIQRKIQLASIYKTQYNKQYLSKISDYAFEIGDEKAIERLWGPNEVRN